MERSRRSTRAGGAELGGKKTGKKEPEKKKTNNALKEKSSPTKSKKEEEERPESPFFGFTNADIPQPIVIKTEPVGEKEISEARNPDQCGLRITVIFLVSLDVEYDLDFKVIRLFMYLRGSGSVKCQFCSFTLRERVLKKWQQI